MGLQMLHRLRRTPGVAVWPFQGSPSALVVLAEIETGLVDSAVNILRDLILDAVQVARLLMTLSGLPKAELVAWMATLPESAQEGAWVLGTGQDKRRAELAQGDLPTYIIVVATRWIAKCVAH